MKKIILVMCFMLFCSLASVSGSVLAEGVVVITSEDNKENITEDDVRNIFLGKVGEFSSGKKAEPLNIISTDPSYEIFSRRVLRKSPSQLRAYWAKRVFTGKGLPPVVVGTKEELLEAVTEKDSRISYVELNGEYKGIRMVLLLD